jgi:uracil-DNA glycosylase family 4
MDRAGLDPDQVYLTNAVKHFSFRERGKRRIHQRPTRGQVVACHPWLEAELRSVRPQVVGLLGAIAAQSIFGARAAVGELRDQALTLPGSDITAVVSIHPSAVLRADPSDRDRMRAMLTDDLRLMRSLVS